MPGVVLESGISSLNPLTGSITKIHLLVVTTSLSTVLVDPERLLGEVGTHVLESSAGAGGCWRVLADAASSGGPGGHLTEPGGPRRSPADADGHGGRGRQWRTRRTVADTAGARDVADTADEADMVATKGTVRTCVIQKVAGAGDDTDVATGRWQVGVREELTTLHVCTQQTCSICTKHLPSSMHGHTGSLPA